MIGIAKVVAKLLHCIAGTSLLVHSFIGLFPLYTCVVGFYRCSCACCSTHRASPCPNNWANVQAGCANLR